MTFSCSVDTHKGRKSQNKTKEEEKAFFEKIIKIGDASNVSTFKKAESVSNRSGLPPV